MRLLKNLLKYISITFKYICKYFNILKVFYFTKESYKVTNKQRYQKIERIVIGLGGIIRVRLSRMGMFITIILISMSATIVPHRHDVETLRSVMTREPLSDSLIVMRAICGGAQSTPTSISIGKTIKCDQTIWDGREEGGGGGERKYGGYEQTGIVNYVWVPSKRSSRGSIADREPKRRSQIEACR